MPGSTKTPARKLGYVILRDYRSRWDGVVQKVLLGVPSLERSVVPGEIAVFEPTGKTVEHVETVQLRTKTVEKKYTAHEYRRVRTRLV